jgi:transposase
VSGFQLTLAHRRRLEQQLRTTTDAGLYRRTLAVLEAAAGRPIAEIARLLRTSRTSIYQWIDGFERTGHPSSLTDHRGGNRPTLWTEDLRAVLGASLAHRPDYFGYQAVEWTVPLLQEQLGRWSDRRPSATSIRRLLHELRYAWKRPRYVLDPDPERDKKTPDPPSLPGLAAPLGQAVRG